MAVIPTQLFFQSKVKEEKIFMSKKNCCNILNCASSDDQNDTENHNKNKS